MIEISSKAEIGCLQELCKEHNFIWKWSKLPEGRQDGYFVKDREIHGKRDAWSTAQRLKEIWTCC